MTRYYYSIASSSSGNCALYQEEGTKLLIDVGVSFRALTTALFRINLAPQDLDGVVITHEHIDHIKGIAMLLKKTKVPVYLTCGTAFALSKKIELDPSRIITYNSGDRFSVGGLTVESFQTPHDAHESVGFLVCSQAHRLGYVTDIGFMPKDILEKLKGSQTVVLESNHDLALLENGPYPYHLKERIRSDRGHLSNDDCADVACELVQNGTQFLLLAHLSEQNNTARAAAQKTIEKLKEKGILLGDQLDVKVAPVMCAAECYDLTGRQCVIC